MREALELLRRVPLLDWLTEEGAETLSNCFDLTVEEPPPGRALPTAGRIGCLLRGEAVFHREGGRTHWPRGTFSPWTGTMPRSPAS